VPDVGKQKLKKLISLPRYYVKASRGIQAQALIILIIHYKRADCPGFAILRGVHRRSKIGRM
jgi:hypothetical protein